MSHTVSPDVHRMLADAITAIRSGDKARGQTLLAQVLRIDPRNETAWLWMASVAKTPEQRRECLERALTINPNNEDARRALKALSDSPPSRAPRDTGAPDQAFRSSLSSDLKHAQTVMQAEGTLPDQARHCPQCSAPVGAPDTVCAFCKSPLAPPSSASDTLSYPKRTPLTSQERRQLQSDQHTTRRLMMEIFRPSAGCALVMAFLVIFSWLVGAILVVSNLAMFEGYVILIGITSAILPLLILESHKAYSVKRFLSKLTALTECPVLDVWNYEDYEGIFHHFVAWELTVIDRYGMAMRYRQAQKIDKELYECLQTRATVQVRYAPDQPDIAMLDERWVTAIKGASST
ncbi:MAG: hypothetical protein J7466_11370 [Roseiflexus sp.]|nr:hypothetical protein [Roseiflexus sp.]